MSLRLLSKKKDLQFFRKVRNISQIIYLHKSVILTPPDISWLKELDSIWKENRYKSIFKAAQTTSLDLDTDENLTEKAILYCCGLTPQRLYRQLWIRIRIRKFRSCSKAALFTCPCCFITHVQSANRRLFSNLSS